MIAEEIIKKAVSALKEHLNSGADVNYYRTGTEKYYDYGFEIKYRQQKLKFLAVLKNRLSKADAGLLVNSYTKINKNLLVISGYISPTTATILKDVGIQFIDAAGNAFISSGLLHINVLGKKIKTKAGQNRSGRLYYPAGLKIIFGFLCKPEILNNTYREISDKTGVSLGAVSRVFNDLIRLGFVIKKDRKRLLIRKKELLENWISGYHDKLRPKILNNNLSSDSPGWHQNIQIRDYNALWGGETAAEKITHQIKPGIITIYASDAGINRLIVEEKLKKSENGEIEILKKFWKFDYDESECVPPILVYADLIISGDSRNIETAGLIYEKHLSEYH